MSEQGKARPLALRCSLGLLWTLAHATPVQAAKSCAGLCRAALHALHLGLAFHFAMLPRLLKFRCMRHLTLLLMQAGEAE